MRIRSIVREVPRPTAPRTYPESMDPTGAHDDEQVDLLSRLEVIEAQPLHTRAGAYEGLHDALARRLESGPTGTTSPS
jgi:hypothetical protein